MSVRFDRHLVTCTSLCRPPPFRLDSAPYAPFPPHSSCPASTSWKDPTRLAHESRWPAAVSRASRRDAGFKETPFFFEHSPLADRIPRWKMQRFVEGYPLSPGKFFGGKAPLVNFRSLPALQTFLAAGWSGGGGTPPYA